MTDTHQLTVGTRVVHRGDLTDDGTIPPRITVGTITGTRANGKVLVQWRPGGQDWLHTPSRLKALPPLMNGADPACTRCHGTGMEGTGEGRDYCRCTDGPDCGHCGAADGQRHHITCRHGGDQ